jgi:putative DNA primase/helicase
VDGQLQPLTELRDTGWTYASLPALEIDPSVAPLSDAEGAAILDLFHNRMQWENAGDGLLIAGSIVLGNICGALDIRPGLQLTGPSQGGKSTTERKLVRPLQGGLGVRPSGATEAGIRQKLKSDALPVVIDESEQESPKVREGHLKLLRLSFDGQEQIKGTAGGEAHTYTMRSSITLIGINATVPNTADRNRLVVIRPRKMPAAQWTEFQLQRDALVTVETGRRLIRRSVSNLKALVANIKTFQVVVAGQGLADRSAEVYGSLLAGAHHLTSTAVLESEQALAWLDSMGWTGLDQETQEAIASDAEGLACIEHLLGHSVMWKGSQTGSVDVRELVGIVKGNPKAEDAVKALGRLGVKFDRERGLVVSNRTRIFSGTRWANGAHRDRLLEVDGAERVSAAVWFTGGGTHKAVAIPVEHLALTDS